MCLVNHAVSAFTEGRQDPEPLSYGVLFDAPATLGLARLVLRPESIVVRLPVLADADMHILIKMVSRAILVINEIRIVWVLLRHVYIHPNFH